MTDSLYLISGATGKTGGGTVKLLLERGHRVRAMVRREDERSRALAAAGAEIAVADLHDLNGVSAAMRGVTGAYLCHPIAPSLIEATVNFAQAATDAGVRSVVDMSQISARRDAGSDAARQHWLSERLLDRTGLLTAHLRPTFFAEWLTTWWELRDGEGYLRLPFGEGRHAPIAAADQSHVIAALLTDPEPHDRAVYTLHGPVELDHHEIAAAMAATLGFPVHYEPISVDEFAAAMTARGLSPHLVQHLSHVAVDYRNGVFAGTNDNVERVGHRVPQSVGEFVTAHKDRFDLSGPNFVPAESC
ncbi:NmrA family NAD(P)-binding protein [Amycolatopsis sp. NBC_01480]|uniref:NmrA family NAD(P)-binding protein n=1 Tax=Amycolatopsis sp. NBC_01480 TaxID=2903562 RepID=UPI002E2D66F3|nr:NmrA family NAD(P)-binding protein [Amycolatopsis sp. NBC_01480]